MSHCLPSGIERRTIVPGIEAVPWAQVATGDDGIL
jgi:hypothetical protein